MRERRQGQVQEAEHPLWGRVTDSTPTGPNHRLNGGVRGQAGGSSLPKASRDSPANPTCCGKLGGVR